MIDRNTFTAEQYADIAYGLLILIGLVAIRLSLGAWIGGVTFGFGVILGYIVHVAWRMSQFDPEQTVDEMEDDLSEMKDDISDIREQMNEQ